MIEAQRPPRGLKAAGRRLWTAVTSVYVLEGHHTVLLRLACEAEDRGVLAQEVLEQGGLFTTDRFGQRVEHPAVKTAEREAALVKGLIRELGLDTQASEEYSRGPVIVGRGARSG